MKTNEEIEKRLAELKADERMTYPHANVFVNSPLALIQVGIGSQIHALEWALGLPLSTFPLPKNKG